MVLTIIAVGNGAVCAQDQLDWIPLAKADADVYSILIDESNPAELYIGCRGGVQKSIDGGVSFTNVLFVSGHPGSVTCLAWHPLQRGALYAASTSGVFYSVNSARTWEKIFSGIGSGENAATCLVVSAGIIYAGTEAGLFTSGDGGRTWDHALGALGRSRIVSICAPAGQPRRIWAASPEGVFLKGHGPRDWIRVFAAGTHEVENDGSQAHDPTPELMHGEITALGVASQAGFIYAARGDSVYRSQDAGCSWQVMTGYGLFGGVVTYLYVSKDNYLYAVTASGIFVYSGDMWKEVSLQLPDASIRSITADGHGNLYAAASAGVFVGRVRSAGGVGRNSLASYIDQGPGIRQVQERAIVYADVSPEKIAKWRRQAASSALLPEVRVGINRNGTDFWHWEGGSTSKPEDDILRKGRDIIEWDIGLAWDLGKIIWNEDQTSIDTRSKLMAELRDTILDQVTKLYFERIRTIIELDNLGLDKSSRRLEKELRVKELTASLDALTGGYFSQEAHPQRH
jgi:photosystem II stability/assembly factor-like uncharacterized protein